MDFDYFDPRILTGVIIKRPRKHTLFSNMFKRNKPSAGETFDLHVVSKGVSMLPAITNHSPGTMRRADSTAVYTVKAPRFRPKRLFKASDMLKQPAGSNPYDPLDNPLERAIVEDMDAHRTEIDYTLEVMCAQAVVDGKVDLYDMVDGKRVKTYTVDFKRPDEHKVLLSGTTLWTNANSDLSGQIDEWADKIMEETNYSPTDLYLGTEAWNAFKEHKDVKEALDNRRIDVGQIEHRVGRQFKGYWGGLRIWVVAGIYVDMDGEYRRFIDPKYVLLQAADAEAEIEFGMPVDLECTHPVEVFAKFFKQDDPSGIFTLCETRPLPWVKQPGWTVLAKVIGG